jgi:uncharacterized protein Yka (UPF0111/DUF47 family)
MDGERQGNGEPKKLADRIFPPKYNFYHMLRAQAEETAAGVKELLDWLKAGAMDPPDKLSAIEMHADDLRHELEFRLQEAFSTPFDRQDIYSISRQMDQIINFSLSTAVEMRAFGVKPDEAIMTMADSLWHGALQLATAVEIMHRESNRAPGLIREMRKRAHEIEDTYINSMAQVLSQNDAILALKKREVYHHLLDAGRNMNTTVNILHRIIVTLP